MGEIINFPAGDCRIIQTRDLSTGDSDEIIKALDYCLEKIEDNHEEFENFCVGPEKIIIMSTPSGASGFYGKGIAELMQDVGRILDEADRIAGKRWGVNRAKEIGFIESFRFYDTPPAYHPFLLPGKLPKNKGPALFFPTSLKHQKIESKVSIDTFSPRRANDSRSGMKGKTIKRRLGK